MMKARIRKIMNDQDWNFFYKFEVVTFRNLVTTDKSLTDDEIKEKIVKYLDEKKKQIILMAVNENDQPAGYIWLAEKPSGGEVWESDTDVAWVYDIIVDQEYRRQGIAKLLLEHGYEWARLEGFNKVGLHVVVKNVPAVNLYYSVKFKLITCYLQKKIENKSQVNSPNEKNLEERDKTIYEKEFREIVFNRFYSNAQMTSKVTRGDFQEKFNKWFNHLYNELDSKIVFQNDISNYIWFYKTRGFLTIIDLVARTEVFMQVLLSYIEKACLEEDLKGLFIAVHKSQDKLLKILVQNGFTYTNLILEREIE
ncbi:MAG: GNAT family N-acetyltransferase [Candidatus Hodarchaeales archaeon]